MVASSGIVTWVWILWLSGAASLPLGGAPLPLDPALSAIAPPECLWYAGYAGQGAADPVSKNQTELLLAEPQVQRLADEIQTQFHSALRRFAGADQTKQALTEHAPKLLYALLTRPSAAYVEELTPKEGGGFSAAAAFVLNAGDQREAISATIEELLKLLPADGPQITAEKVADVDWRRVAAPPEAPTVRFGWHGDYLILAVGDETPGELLKRMGGSAPAWLTKIREEHPIERELSIGYLNVAGILDIARPMIEKADPKAWIVMETLGLTSIRALHGVSGYDAIACKSIAHLVTDGSRTGLLGLLPQQRLEALDLQPVPKDAFLAVAVGVDTNELWDNGLKLMAQLDSQFQSTVDRGLREIETNLRINVRDDIVKPLDDAWVLFLPGGDLMSSWLTATAAIKVKDSATLSATVAKLAMVAQAEMARGGNRGSISASKIGQQTLYTLQLPTPAPIAPCWIVADGWLILSLSPNAARSALERRPEDSLAAASGIAEALATEGGAVSLSFQDTPRLVRSLYPWLNMGLQAASGELRRAGVEFDPAVMPSEEAIIKHLRPGITTWSVRSDGFLFTSQHSLPGETNLAAVTPVAVGLLVPAVGSAREAARRAQDLNNLKQLALGALNNEAATGSLPSDIYSDDGQPLLSWRVRLLPYMEQNDLYQQFHLDEPWDSEHNQKLLAKMPPPFRSPDDPAETTKTRFVAFKGEGTLFPGDVGIKLQEVEDGTSNTLLFAQAAPDHAVEWTKPADLDFDPDKPFVGLESPTGAFLAAMCDGSCRPLSLAIEPEDLRRLVDRADGEMIDNEAISLPPGQPAAR